MTKNLALSEPVLRTGERFDVDAFYANIEHSVQKRVRGIRPYARTTTSQRRHVHDRGVVEQMVAESVSRPRDFKTHIAASRPPQW